MTRAEEIAPYFDTVRALGYEVALYFDGSETMDITVFGEASKTYMIKKATWTLTLDGPRGKNRFQSADLQLIKGAAMKWVLE
jgi:hypothetical protein